MNALHNYIMCRPVAVGMAYGALLVGGIVAFIRLPIALAPKTDLPSLAVLTSWERVSAETVERTITAPLEEIAGTVNGVKRIISVSREGQSRVSIDFDRKADLERARLILRERIAIFGETLPGGVSPPVLQPFVPEELKDLQGFLSYSLAGNSPTFLLRQYAKEIIAPRLLSVKGVGKVDVLGGAESELQIMLFPARMAAFGVSHLDVAEALHVTRIDARTGILRQGNIHSVLSMAGGLPGVDDLRSLVVAITPGGIPVRLSDIATVDEELAVPAGVYRINGKPSVVIRMDKEPQVNTLHVADAVFTVIQELRSRFPAGMEIVKESDKSQYLRDELGRLSGEIVFSILSIWCVLLLFLSDLRAPFLVLSSIAFSMAATFLVFSVFSISLHLFTLAGLVLGFGRVVDDTIVVMESIQFHRAQESALRISAAMKESARPLSVSTLTSIGALTPSIFLPAELQPYVSDFALSVAIPLVASLVVSLTFIPTMAGLVPARRSGPAVSDHGGAAGMIRYKKLLRFMMRKQWWVIGLAIWALGVPVWLLPDHLEPGNALTVVYNRIFDNRLMKGLRQYLHYLVGGSSYLFVRYASLGEVWNIDDETHILVRINFPHGTEAMLYEKVAGGIEDAMIPYRRHLDKMVTLITHDIAFVQISVGDSAARTSIPLEIRELLVRSAGNTGGAEVGIFGFGSGFSGNSGGVPSLLMEVRGYGYLKVKVLAGRVRKAIQENPRIDDVDIDGSPSDGRVHEILALIDRDALSRFGVTANETVHALRMYAGRTVGRGEVTLDDRRVAYALTYAGHQDFSFHDLESALVTTGSGRTLRLSALISLRERRTEGLITRQNQEYIRWIRCAYKGPQREGELFLDSVIAGIQVPPGYTIRQASSMSAIPTDRVRSTWWIVLAVVAIVFMVTASLYESFVKAFIVIFSIPLSFIGLFLVFSLTSLPFGRGGYAAMLLLIGIVTTNTILLVDFTARRVVEDGLSVGTIIDAACRRVRAVLMTTMTTLGGLVPFLWMADRSSMWYSLAWGTAGGLVSSLVLTLIVIPVAYSAAYGGGSQRVKGFTETVAQGTSRRSAL